MDIPTVMIPRLTILPTTKPTIAARMFLAKGFMVKYLTYSVLHSTIDSDFRHNCISATSNPASAMLLAFLPWDRGFAVASQLNSSTIGPIDFCFMYLQSRFWREPYHGHPNSCCYQRKEEDVETTSKLIYYQRTERRHYYRWKEVRVPAISMKS